MLLRYESFNLLVNKAGQNPLAQSAKACCPLGVMQCDNLPLIIKAGGPAGTSGSLSHVLNEVRSL